MRCIEHVTGRKYNSYEYTVSNNWNKPTDYSNDTITKSQFKIKLKSSPAGAYDIIIGVDNRNYKKEMTHKRIRFMKLILTSKILFTNLSTIDIILTLRTNRLKQVNTLIISEQPHKQKMNSNYCILILHMDAAAKCKICILAFSRPRKSV
eukprot:94891_1